MRRNRLRTPIALAAVLAVWFGILAGLPHIHSNGGDAPLEQVCSAPAADHPTSHLHAVRHTTQRPCLACLIAGATAAPVARIVDLAATTAVGTAAIAVDISRARTRAQLPDQRGPPVPA